jgi:hypothetical protein
VRPARIVSRWTTFVDANRFNKMNWDDLTMLNWPRANPEVPEGKWFKKFSGMTVCGEGELVKTFLQAGQLRLARS